MDEFDNLVTQLQQVSGNLSSVVRNPPHVSASEKTSGSETSLRSFSPEDIAEMARTHAQSSAVTSVFGRQGAITPSFGDYNADQIAEGAAKVVMTIAERAKLANLPLSVKDCGAAGNGINDDTAAIRAAVAAAAREDRPLYFPAGTYRFSSTITVTQQRAAWFGAGHKQTVLLYAGASTTNDLIVFGDGVDQIIGCQIEGFRIRSSTTMTAGCALRLRKFCRSIMRGVVADGQDGDKKLCHGIYFEEVDHVVCRDFETSVQQTGVAVCGGVGVAAKADLYLSGFKISGGTVGLHIGGAFGGIYCDHFDIIVNAVNVKIDEALRNEVNREVFFGNGAIDSALTGPNVLINSPSQGNCWYQFNGTWVATSAGTGIRVQAANSQKVLVAGGRHYNNAGDAIRIEDARCVALVTGNSITTNRGYGINPAVGGVKLAIGDNIFENNGLGDINNANTPAVRAKAWYTTARDMAAEVFRLDATCYLQMQGGSPLINFDANDYLLYDRGGNQWTFLIGGSAVAAVRGNGAIQFTPRTAPASAARGDVYFDKSANKLRVHNGTAWIDLH
jgi:hypothetical protein